jgi:cold shock CspA family protein
MQSGTIKNWNDKKGFGFISPKSGGKDIFTHISDFSKKHQTPTKGIEVNYFLSTDPKGRRYAVEVRPIKGHKKIVQRRKRELSLLLYYAVFLESYSISLNPNCFQLNLLVFM